MKYCSTTVKFCKLLLTDLDYTAGKKACDFKSADAQTMSRDFAWSSVLLY